MSKAPPTDDFDSPWKEALQRYLRSILQFFWPDIYNDVDWARGYQSLDKEFQQIVRRAKTGKRLADKLFKIWLKDGAERWLLVHIEIQSAYAKDFARRMFEYNLAAWQLYGKTVVSLAVLCDDRPRTATRGRDNNGSCGSSKGCTGASGPRKMCANCFA
ncbi:MAG: Rpn family recombination-promoting nuclease/putative transposase [Gemmataceae bacterium]|nr:Rpn family recombination-promoting nuclease/putative transposase [Gemmataceae bacterium]